MKKTIKILLIVLIVLALIVGGLILVRNKYLPLEYQSEIEACSREFNLDPYYVTAVIRTESRFRPGVVSSAGAVGLMQIQPETGEWIAGKLDMEFSADKLTDPAVNIRLGCWYLRFLLDRFDDPIAALAAYNSGQGRVDDWLASDEHSKDGITLDEIPFEETRNYVKKVERFEKLYKWLYPGLEKNDGIVLE